MTVIQNVGVVGSGTMGAGIAQLLIQHGYNTVLCDINEEVVNKATNHIYANLERLVVKKRMQAQEAEQSKRCLQTTVTMTDLTDCQLVIEAASENSTIKQSIFQELEKVCAQDTILATNTSSLSITEISGHTDLPARVAGLHFFNPAPIMPLVEIIAGLKTSDETIQTLVTFSHQINKNPVVCKDTPGFVVNRVARPFYNEALRIMNDGVATVEQIDHIMKKAGNFRMGPFELQDLIGIDINFATTQSVHNGYYGESRFRPHYFQERMVHSGSLGRKTKGGFFAYDS